MTLHSFYIQLSRRRTLVAALAVGLAVSIATYSLLQTDTAGVAGAQTVQMTLDEQHLVYLTNRERTDLDLKTLSWNTELYKAAQEKVTHLFDNQYFDHISPTGTTPWYFIRESGYDYQSAGENLAIGFTKNESIVTAWMNSPAHKANIVDPDFQHIAIATKTDVLDGQAVTMVVQMFGEPTGLTIEISQIRE